MFYDNVRKICKEKGTSISVVLTALGRSTGATSSWKAGRMPKLDILMEMADYLNVSLDYLVYGKQSGLSNELNDDELELLDIYRKIPERSHPMCKAFLETHIANEIGLKSGNNA